MSARLWHFQVGRRRCIFSLSFIVIVRFNTTGSFCLSHDNQVGNFLITPNSKAVAVAQGEGIALLSLETQAEPLDFLAKFGQIPDFTSDGTGATMIDYNTDSEELKYTRSLYYVNNQGLEKRLLNTDGSIQNCQFEPTTKHLYC